MGDPARDELARFLRGRADAAAFTHREHVRMAWEILRRHDFAQAAWLYSRALRRLTERIGQPGKFHQTLTIALLSAIAERMESGPQDDFETFAGRHPELLDTSLVRGWYDAQRLGQEAARRIFLMPEASKPG